MPSELAETTTKTKPRLLLALDGIVSHPKPRLTTQQCHVVVAEDDEDLRGLLTMRLGKLGYVVTQWRTPSTDADMPRST